LIASIYGDALHFDRRRRVRDTRQTGSSEGKPVEELLQPVVDELINESAYLASVDEGLAELDAGKGLDGDEVFRNLHAMLANLKR
jgi:hypothetical protein